MAISSIGVGSGLPLDQLLSDLRKSENQSLVLIEQRKKQSEARLSGYSVLKGSLTDLQKAAQALNDPQKYGALKASSSSEALSISVNNSAVAGNYTLSNVQLATSQSLTLNGYANRDQNIGTGGTLTIQLNNGEDAISVDLGNDTSLQGIMKTINANPDLGVQATIINDGSADAPYRLMLTATGTGTEASVASITVEDNETLNTLLQFDASNLPQDPNVEQRSGNFSVTAAKNASFDLNGITITSQSNTIKDVIEGVTLDLNSAPTEEIRIAITRDDTVATNAVKDFVKAYNALLSTIKTQTSFNIESGTSSALTGDSLVRRVESQLRSTLSGTDGVGAIRSFTDLGIKTDYKTGLLEIDEDKLAEAVKNNLEDVTGFFNGDNGVGKKFDTFTNEYLKFNGFIQNATDSLNTSIRDIQRQYEATQDRIDNKMESYRRQFSQLDVMMNQMSGISNYLTQQLSMLGNMNSNK